MTTETNQEIIDLILHNPLIVTELQLKQLIDTQNDLFGELRKMVIRVFDINERSLLEESDATTGFMGRFNRISQKARTKKYYKKIKDPSFKRGNEKNIVIVAEGDSWFQFPVFVKDIVDWLGIRNPQYAIYSIANGGNWLTNMIYDGKYVEELSIHKPDVFLLSGSGNDLVGSSRLALMVDKNAKYPKYKFINEISDRLLSAEEKIEVFSVQGFINKEFYSFILIIKLQYWKIISSINYKFPEMKIITQGYDYGIPSYKFRWSARYPLEYVINWALDSGKWLIRPLRIKGFDNENEQKALVKTFIFELNLIMNDMVKKFPNVYHVDARGTANSFEDWFDELHLKSHVFKNVARAFEHFIKMPVKNLEVAHMQPAELSSSADDIESRIIYVKDLK